MAKKKKQERKKSWCWYCDREFDDDKILFQHQRMKHFKCNTCHRKLNSASGLVIHMAQVHKETMEKVPNAVEGHDTPELEIYCMDGVPEEDLQRHYDGLPIVPYTKSKHIIGDASILPILAAQKASVAAQLAESKNMTVIGDIAGAGVGSIVSPTGSGASSFVSPAMSSATSVVSPPLPAAAVAVSAPVPPVSTNGQASAADYWNNPYVMAAYYQQQQGAQYPGVQYPQNAQYPQYPQNAQYAQQQAAYAQYYQAYAAQYYSQQSQSVPSVTAPVTVTQTAPVKAVEEVAGEGPLMIPAYVDPNTNKTIPGTIFTVLNLDRSMEELRAELKRYACKKQ